MIFSVIWSPDAEKQLDEAIEYVFQHSEKASEELPELLAEEEYLLSTLPRSKPLYPYQGPAEIRYFNHYDFLFIFQVKAQRVIILEVDHSKARPGAAAIKPE